MKSEEIHKLLKTLETKRIDDSTTVSMLHSLRKNAMATKPGVQRLVKQGCVPCLLKLLYRHVACEREGADGKEQSIEDGVSTALSIVSNLLMEREVRQQVKRDGIETLGTVLAEYKVEEIQIRCCRALGNLAMDSHARAAMAQTQLAPTLIRLLEVRYIDAEEEEEVKKKSHPSSKSEPKKGRKAKGAGCDKDEEGQEKKKEKSTSDSKSEAKKKLKTKAESSDTDSKDGEESAEDAFETVFPSWPLVQCTCRALRYLVDDLKMRRQLLDSSMVWAHAVLIKSEDGNIVACVMRVLSELWTKMNKKITEKMSSEMVRAGVVRKIMDMVNSDDDQLSQHAFTVLLPLTQHPHSAALIGASDGVPFFLDLLVSPKWQSSQKEVISGLCLLARESVNRVKIRENGGLKVFLETLRDQKLSGVHDRVISSLLSFLHDNEGLKVLLEEGLVDVLLIHLQQCGGYSSRMPINFCWEAKDLLESYEAPLSDSSTTCVDTLSLRVPSINSSGEKSSAECIKTENQSPVSSTIQVSSVIVESEKLQANVSVSAQYQMDPSESTSVKIKLSMDDSTVGVKSELAISSQNSVSLTDRTHNESLELKVESEYTIENDREEVEIPVSVQQEEMVLDDSVGGNNDDADTCASPFVDKNCSNTHTYSMHSPSYQAETTWHMHDYHPGITRKSFHPSDPNMSPSPGSSGSEDGGSVSSSPYSPLSAGSYHSPSYSNRFSPAYSSAASSPAHSHPTLSPTRSRCESLLASPVYSGPVSPGGSTDVLSPLSPGTHLGSPSWSLQGSPAHHASGNAQALLFSSSEEDSCDVDDYAYFRSKNGTNTNNLLKMSDLDSSKPQHGADIPQLSFPETDTVCDEECKTRMLNQPLEQCSLGFNTDHIQHTACDDTEEICDTEVSLFRPDGIIDQTVFCKHQASSDLRQELQTSDQSVCPRKPEVQGENVEMCTDMLQNAKFSPKPEQTVPVSTNSSIFLDEKETGSGVSANTNITSRPSSNIINKQPSKNSVKPHMLTLPSVQSHRGQCEHKRVKRFLTSNSSESEDDREVEDAVQAAKRRRKQKDPGEYAAITQDNILKLFSCLSDRNDVEKQLVSSKVVCCLLDHLALAREPQERCVRILSRIMSRPLCLEPLLTMCAPAVIVRTLMLDATSGIKGQVTASLQRDLQAHLSKKGEGGSPSPVARRISLQENTSEKVPGVLRRFSAGEPSSSTVSTASQHSQLQMHAQTSEETLGQQSSKEKQSGKRVNHEEYTASSHGCCTSEEGKQKGTTSSQQQGNTTVDLCQAGARLLGHISNQAICPYGEGVVSYALNRHEAPRQLAFATSLLFLMPYWDRDRRRKVLFSKGTLDKLLSALCTPHATSRAIKEAIVTGIVFLLHHLQPEFRFAPEESDSLLHKAVKNLVAGTAADQLTTSLDATQQMSSSKVFSYSDKVCETSPHPSESESCDQINICVYSAAEKDLHLQVAEAKTQLGANRNVLMKKSAMFAAMLQGSYIESTQSEITITDSSQESLNFILHFLHGCDERCSILVPRKKKEKAFMADSYGDFESPNRESLKDTCAVIETETAEKPKTNPRASESFLITTGSSVSDDDDKLQNSLNTIALADRFLLPELTHYLCSVLSCSSLDKASAADIFQFAAFHGLKELAEDSMLMLLCSPGPLTNTASQLIELAQSEVSSEVKTTITSLVRRGVTMAGK